MLDTTMKTQLQAYLAKLQRPIQLIGHDTLQIPFQDCSLDFGL